MVTDIDRQGASSLLTIFDATPAVEPGRRLGRGGHIVLCLVLLLLIIVVVVLALPLVPRQDGHPLRPHAHQLAVRRLGAIAAAEGLVGVQRDLGPRPGDLRGRVGLDASTRGLLSLL